MITTKNTNQQKDKTHICNLSEVCLIGNICPHSAEEPSSYIKRTWFDDSTRREKNWPSSFTATKPQTPIGSSQPWQRAIQEDWVRTGTSRSCPVKEKSVFKVIQINLNHCKAARVALCNKWLIQEPYIYLGNVRKLLKITIKTKTMINDNETDNINAYAKDLQTIIIKMNTNKIVFC